MSVRRSRRGVAAACIVLCLGGIAFAETHHKLPCFRLLTFAQLFLGLAIVTGVCRAKLQSAMLSLTTLVLGLVLLEAAGNWVIARRGALETARDRIPVADQAGSTKTRQDMVDANLFSPMVGVGWRLAKSGDFHVVKIDPTTDGKIYDVHYTIDSNLDRRTASADGGPAVVFLGDSFTFGSGVDDSETMPQRLADLSGRNQRIVNLGVPGYSPAQVLYQLRYGIKAQVIGPTPSALVMLTGPYHASRIACKDTFTNPAPRFALHGSSIVYEGPCYSGVERMWREFLDNSASYRAFVAPLTRRVNRADLDLYVDLVAEVSRTAEKMYGLKPLVPFINFPRAPQETVLAKLREKGVDAIDMTLDGLESTRQPITIPGDGHPTAYAHGLRAAMIKNALESRGVPLRRLADVP